MEYKWWMRSGTVAGRWLGRIGELRCLGRRPKAAAPNNSRMGMIYERAAAAFGRRGPKPPTVALPSIADMCRMVFLRGGSVFFERGCYFFRNFATLFNIR